LFTDRLYERLPVDAFILDVKKCFESKACLEKSIPLMAFTFTKLQILLLPLEEPLEEVDFIFRFVSWEAVGRHLPQKHASAVEHSIKKTKAKDMIKSSVTKFRIGTSAFFLNLFTIIKTSISYLNNMFFADIKPGFPENIDQNLIIFF
jgi:hypothetical protein